jgi:hypothetical protein
MRRDASTSSLPSKLSGGYTYFGTALEGAKNLLFLKSGSKKQILRCARDDTNKGGVTGEKAIYHQLFRIASYSESSRTEECCL